MKGERTSKEPLRSVPPADDPLEKVLVEIRKSKKRMENRLKQLEVDVQYSQQEAVQEATKRAKCGKSFSFNKEGHQEQHEFNEKVMECLEGAADEIARRPATESSLDRARDTVKEGLRFLGTSQK